MSIERLKQVMMRLRDPQGGCPWDLEQTLRSIAPYTLEETYELVEALEAGEPRAIREELGDLLFQVVFLAEIARQDGLFDFDTVADAVAAKMIERHPHVFGNRAAATAADVAANWEADKAARRALQADGKPSSLMDGVSTALPAATRAVKIQARAARCGFEWDDAREMLVKVQEEIGELEAEMTPAPDPDRLEDELGDVLFSVINVARKLGLDPETALRRTNRKFERRFRGVEDALARDGRTTANTPRAEMDRIWGEIKLAEKPPQP